MFHYFSYFHNMSGDVDDVVKRLGWRYSGVVVVSIAAATAPVGKSIVFPYSHSYNTVSDSFLNLQAMQMLWRAIIEWRFR